MDKVQSVLEYLCNRGAHLGKRLEISCLALCFEQISKLKLKNWNNGVTFRLICWVKGKRGESSNRQQVEGFYSSILHANLTLWSDNSA